MKKVFTLFLFAFIITQGVFAQGTVNKFGFSWDYPSGWEAERVSGNEGYLTPSYEQTTVTFVSMKSFSLRNENDPTEEIKSFLLSELGTSDESAFDDAESEQVFYGGITGFTLKGIYMDEDFEMTDYYAYVTQKGKKVVVVIGSIYNGGDFDASYDRLVEVEGIIESIR